MRYSLLFVIAVMFVSLIAITPVTAEPEAISECDDAPVLTPGTYESTLTPDSQYLFRIDNVDQGDYMVFDFEYDSDDGLEPEIGYPRTGPGQYADSDELESYSQLSGTSDDWDESSWIINVQPEGTGEIWVEEDKPVCIAISDTADSGGGYAFSFDVNEAEPPDIVTPTEAEALEDEIDDLQEEIDELESEDTNQEVTTDELESEIADLEEKIDDLDEENTELQSDKEELEAALESAENGDVTIDISVEPADAAEFQVGGEAVMDLDVTGASPEDISIEFAGDEYEGADGQATLPLEAAGTQEMSVEYGDEVETVSIDVNEEADGEQDQEAEDDTISEADDTGVGFGVIAGVSTLVLLVGVALYRQKM